LGAEKITDGFPHSKNQVHASMLIENQTDLDYVEWLSQRFKFLQKDVVTPYLAKKEFETIIDNAPQETQLAWNRFVDAMNRDCEQTQAYIENAWNNRKIEGTVSK
jgi:methylaspartate ammonia-lyase